MGIVSSGPRWRPSTVAGQKGRAGQCEIDFRCFQYLASISVLVDVSARISRSSAATLLDGALTCAAVRICSARTTSFKSRSMVSQMWQVMAPR